jgi:hypothetical protein
MKKKVKRREERQESGAERKKDALILMELSPRYLVLRGEGMCGRKELWEKGPSG